MPGPVVTVSKHFKFSAAHRLPHHDGLCRGLHGHTYRLEVSVKGPVRLPSASQPAPDEGMVLDFGRIKDVYKEEVEPLVEHQYLNETLLGRLPSVKDETLGATVALTTSENMAVYFQELFQARLGDPQGLPPTLVTVRLWESPESYAEAGPRR